MSNQATLKSRYERAQTLEAFIAGAQQNQELWQKLAARAAVSADLVDRAARLPAPRHLLVLVEDWCGDAVNTVPPLAKLAAAVPQLDLRVLARDEHPDLMDAHLTNGARAIPVVMVLDEHYEELGWWGPRPRELQRWVLADGQALEKPERYKMVRTWYARDRGRATLEEVLAIAEGGAAQEANEASGERAA
jgi:hypothetical protein